MTTYTIVDGQSGYEVAAVEAATPLEAAIAGHRRQLADDKRPIHGWDYEEHGPRWGLPADRINGNGAQSLDDCLIVVEGTIADGALFDARYDEHRVSAIVQRRRSTLADEQW